MTLFRLARRLLTSQPNGENPSGVQYGAVPYRLIEGQAVFLMITSRRSANWVFPKGSPMKGLTPVQTVAEEAYEEAGIRGEIADTPIGSYLHPRNGNTGVVRVELYPMRVTDQLDTWPEEAQRFRHWALLPQVKRLMASRQAARIAAELNRVLAQSQRS